MSSRFSYVAAADWGWLRAIIGRGLADCELEAV